MDSGRKSPGRQAHYYNRGARDLKPLKIQDPVRIAPPDGLGQTREWKRGTVTKVLPNRSYEIQSDGVNYRRNRRHLRFTQRKQQEPLELEDIAPEEFTESSVMKDKTSTKTATDMKLTMESSDESVTSKAPQPITRSGREVKEPIRFKDYVK